MKFDGGLSRLRSADDDVVQWLDNITYETRRLISLGNVAVLGNECHDNDVGDWHLLPPT